MKYIFVSAAFLLVTGSSFAQDNNAQDAQKNDALANSVNEMTKIGYAGGVGSMMSFHSKDDTKGSRYLFQDWVKGSVTDNDGAVYNGYQYSYNYDKMTNDLYLTQDKKEVIQVDKAKIQKFSLTSPEGKVSNFVRIPSIKPDAFFEVLVDNNAGYSLFKLTTTKFTKANFRTDGLTESGKNYDEYADDDTYYLELPGGKEFKPVSLTKKSIKKSIGDNAKADSFASEHKYDKVDEHYVQELVQALNG